ncbi:MAG: hypothetical protein RI941_412 [Pseudomonadota bacterium]|jgi:hypothetical protein
MEEVVPLMELAEYFLNQPTISLFPLLIMILI